MNTPVQGYRPPHNMRCLHPFGNDRNNQDKLITVNKLNKAIYIFNLFLDTCGIQSKTQGLTFKCIPTI